MRNVVGCQIEYFFSHSDQLHVLRIMMDTNAIRFHSGRFQGFLTKSDFENAT